MLVFAKICGDLSHLGVELYVLLLLLTYTQFVISTIMQNTMAPEEEKIRFSGKMKKGEIT